MSIATEITRLQNAKASIKTSIENKGVTVPSATKLDGYSTLIDSIQTGITPTGTISITTNGTVDVTNYASADVDVPVGWTNEDIEVGAPNGSITSTSVSVRKLAYAGSSITSYTNTNITSLSARTFDSCLSLTDVWMPSLETIDTQNFVECKALQSIALPSLKKILSYNNFSACTHLTIADFGGKLERIRTYTFNSCTVLRNLVLRRTDQVVPLEIWNQVCMGGIFQNPSSSVIYVPQNLISSYQQATNWVTAYGAGLTFSAIEGSYYETHYADGTPIGS